MAFGMSPFPLRFGSRGVPTVIPAPDGTWLVRTASGAYVSCYEVEQSVYESAADDLGESEAVQTAAWTEALLGRDRLFIPQSLATSVQGGIAHCELGLDPYTGINFDDAQAACWAMGPNWTLMTQAQWHVLAVISQSYWAGQGKSNPTGNTQHGRSHSHNSEVGIRSDGLPVTGSNQGTYGRTLTGQRAVGDGGGLLLPWSHDGTANGVFDLVGNALEWTASARIVGWEIQIIPASAGVQVDHGVSSTAWRAILADGTLVDPGTASTLKYSTDTGTYLSETQAGTGRNLLFKDVGAGAISPVPPILIAMGLFPWSSSVPTVGWLYASQSGERALCRGGAWSYVASAGVGLANFNNARSITSSLIGFRPTYVA